MSRKLRLKLLRHYLRGIRKAKRLLAKRKSAVLVAAGTLLVLMLPILLYHNYIQSPPGTGKVVKVVDFASGSSMKTISSELAKAGIITSSSLFNMLARIEHADVKAKAGTYRFTDAMTPKQILRMLETGEVYELRFTVPEGYSIYQIAELLHGRRIFNKDSFLRQCFNPSLLAELDIPAKSVEGFLSPSTYTIKPQSDETALIREMVARFRSRYGNRLADRARALGLGQIQVLILASMIEKEAVLPSEMPVISSVFHNRLRIKMPLQSDPTSVYGVRAFAGRITKRDILRDTPFNTYRIKGLPPGPIGNPSIAAIEAVLYPARTNYLYFVAKMDGTHYFSETLEEHNLAVQKYLKGEEEREILTEPSDPRLLIEQPELLIDRPKLILDRQNLIYGDETESNSGAKTSR